MSVLANSLQKAVFQTLASNSELELLVGPEKIFDHAINIEDYPYISIANWISNDWSTDSDDGEEILFEISIWDDSPAQKQIKDIAAKVVFLLHDQPIALELGTLVNLRFEKVFIQSKARSKLQEASVTFRAKIEN